MKKENEISPLVKKWRIFGQIAGEPWVIILLVFILAFFILLFLEKNTMIVRMLTIFISTTATLLASYATHVWSSLNEEKLTIVKGKTAVRSLKLLLGNIFSIDGRAQQFLHRFCADPKGKKITNEVIKTYFEEILNRYNVLEEETQSSIENWTDILPDVSIKTQIGEITRLREELNLKGQELNILIEEQEKAKGKSEEIGRLKKEIRKKELQISSLQIELQEKDLPFSSEGMWSPVGSTLDLSIQHSKKIYMCPKCKYKFETMDSRSNIKCPDCGTKMSFGTSFWQ